MPLQLNQTEKIDFMTGKKIREITIMKNDDNLGQIKMVQSEDTQGIVESVCTVTPNPINGAKSAFSDEDCERFDDIVKDFQKLSDDSRVTRRLIQGFAGLCGGAREMPKMMSIGRD